MLRGFHPQQFRWCTLHVLNLGICYGANASSLSLTSKQRTLPSQPVLLRILWKLYFCVLPRMSLFVSDSNEDDLGGKWVLWSLAAKPRLAASP